MRGTRKMASVVALSVASFGLSIAAATVAAADPAGCEATKTTVGLTDNGRVYGEGFGSCDITALRYFRAEVKWDKAWAPDPLTASRTVSGKTNWHGFVATCDNGNTRGYYGRTFWTSGSDYHDSSPRDIRAC